MTPLASSEAGSRQALALSAIVLVGRERVRAQQVLDRLNEQTAADCMEIVIADTAGSSYPRLRIDPGGVPTVYLDFSADERWGDVRAAASRAAKGSIAAFVEDHSIPLCTWAEAIVRASPGPWVAAGYAFLNANPGKDFCWKAYLSRAGFITDYGVWAHPVPLGFIRQMPCNNVAYRREALLELGDKLGGMFHTDLMLHEHFSRAGKPMDIIRDAIVAHQNHEEVGVLLEGNFVHCRMIAASRVAEGGWGWPRRLVYALAVPIAVPFMKLGRLLRIQMRRRVLWGVTLASLPVAVTVFVWSSLGETMGYLFGFGNSVERFQQIEASTPRSAELTGEGP